jgi:uncharacterized protein YndB with AHSA1/START domain
MAKNNNLVEQTIDSLTVTRIIKAPCELVFEAWTEPKQMVQWWSPVDIECRKVEADLRIGGTYRIHMITKEGDHIAYGKYTRIILNKRLQFTWQWEHKEMPLTTVKVDFEDLGETTRLTLVQKGFVDKEESEAHTHGWSTAIEKFAGLIEQKKIKF